MNKSFYIFLFILLFCCEAKTQTNLVYNGDFEIYDTCPVNISTPGDLQIEHCLGWTSPTKLGTSDYFNVCNNSVAFQFVGVPKNMLGFQYPYNGNGYCGILAWMYSTNGVNYREYLQTKILQKLKKNKYYNISFNISFSGTGYSIEKIGALLSSDSFTANSWEPIIQEPQIVYNNGNLSDSLNWVKINGEFKANGNEEYLTIGYFVDSLQVFDTVNVYNDSSTTFYSYYYIDGVSLTELPCRLNIPNIFTPNNDGVNDFMKFETCDNIRNITIYNRWGIKVFEVNETNNFWDGRTSSGESCEDGTYFYIITTETTTEKGFIQLMR